MQLSATAKSDLNFIITKIHPQVSSRTIEQLEKNILMIYRAGGNSLEIRGKTIKFSPNLATGMIEKIYLVDEV